MSTSQGAGLRRDQRWRSGDIDGGFAVREIWLLRLRALLAQARGESASYVHFRDRYREMAKTLGFEGHIEWGEAMQ